MAEEEKKPKCSGKCAVATVSNIVTETVDRRTYIATHAMEALISNINVLQIMDDSNNYKESVVNTAYKIADLMLKK